MAKKASVARVARDDRGFLFFEGDARMTTSAKSITVIALIVLVCAWFRATAAPVGDKDAGKSTQRNPKAVKAFMRGKLDASQQILEGLVTEDFDLISKGADRLRVMSMRAEWNVLRGPVYEDQSASFRRSAELLGKMAKEKNIDGASLTYLHMTMQCINCHKFTRSADVVNAQPRLPPATLFGSKGAEQRNQETRPETDVEAVVR
jgi:hypothetical protein